MKEKKTEKRAEVQRSATIICRYIHTYIQWGLLFLVACVFFKQKRFVDSCDLFDSQ